METIKKESMLILIIIILFTYNINAQTWEEIGLNLSEGDSVSHNIEITFENKNIGWLFTQFYSQSDPNKRYGKLYRTTNGGQNWETALNSNYIFDWTVLYSMEPGFFYMIRGNKGSYTIDGGNTWDSTLIAGSGFSALYFFNEHQGIAFNGYVWTTPNGGKYWQRKSEIILPAPLDVSFYNDMIGWVVSTYSPFGTDAGYIAKTTDGGATWEYQDSTFGAMIDYYGIDFIDSLKGFAAGGYVSKTIDGGNNWETISGVAGVDVGFLDDKNGWISSSGQVFRTSDGGETWIAQQIDNGMDYLFTKIMVLKKDKFAYVLGINLDNYKTTLIKADLSGITDVAENNEANPDKFYLYQNYPNPFNPTTTISYKLPISSYVTLKVYNVLGIEIANLVKETKLPGIYKVNFNGNLLASGVYIARLTAGRFNKSIKLILIK